MKKIMIILMMLILAQSASAQILTRPEVELVIGSKQYYTREEVIDLTMEILTIVDEELFFIQKKIEVEHEAAFNRLKIAFENELKDLEFENLLLWIGSGLVGTGLIVYGVYKGDLPTIGTGVVMVGACFFKIIL